MCIQSKNHYIKFIRWFINLKTNLIYALKCLKQKYVKKTISKTVFLFSNYMFCVETNWIANFINFFFEKSQFENSG